MLTNLKDSLTRIETLLVLQVASTKKVLTSEEAQAYLGISKETLDKYASNRDIPHSKPKHRRYFNREELDQWALSNKVLTNQEIEAVAVNRKPNRKSR